MGVFLQERISLITLTMALMKTRGRHTAKNRRGCEWDSRSLQSVHWPARSLWEQVLQFDINVVFFFSTTESNCLHTDWHLKLTYPKIDVIWVENICHPNPQISSDILYVYSNINSSVQQLSFFSLLRFSKEEQAMRRMFPVYQFSPQNQTSRLQLASTSLQSLRSPGNISLYSAFNNTIQ